MKRSPFGCEAVHDMKSHTNQHPDRQGQEADMAAPWLSYHSKVPKGVEVVRTAVVLGRYT